MRCSHAVDVRAPVRRHPGSHERDRGRTPAQALRRHGRRRRRLVRRRGGRDLRHPRPERRRQDHDRRVLAGLRMPDGGRIRVLGLDPLRDRASCASRSACSSRRASCPTSSRSARRWSCTAPSTATPADWRRAGRRLGLGDKLRTRFAKLSGGQKQRLSIALALVGNPQVAVLDELTTGLDPQARRDTWDADRAHPRPRRDDPAGHPLHGGGRAALRPGRGDRPGPGRRARHPGRPDRRRRRRAAHPVPAVGAARRRAARRCPRSRASTRHGGQVVGHRHRQRARTRSPRCSPATRSSAQRPAGRAGQPGRRLRRAHRPPRRHQGVCVSTGKLVNTEWRLFLREPIVAVLRRRCSRRSCWSSSAHPVVPGARRGPRRRQPSSTTYVPIVIAHGARHARPDGAADGARRPTGRRASCAGCRRRRSARRACSLAQLVVNAAVARSASVLLVLAVGRLAFGVGLPEQLSAFVARLAAHARRRCSAIGLLVAALAPSAQGRQRDRRRCCSSR